MRRKLKLAALLVGGLSSGIFALQCASSEDETVTLDTRCDLTRVSAANPGEATVLAYHSMATAFVTKATALETKLKDQCNAINRALGGTDGADIRAACNAVAKRIDDARKVAPLPDGGIREIWVAIDYLEECDPDPTAEVKCIDSCSGKAPCSVSTACPPGKTVGTCPAECQGVCKSPRSDTPGACVGSCEGQMTVVSDAGAPPRCEGACEGTCPTAPWTARCGNGCSAGFRGNCLGTCNGTCDGIPVGTQPKPDAGPPDAGGDAGPSDAGGDAEAGPPLEAGVEAGSDAGADGGGPVINDGNCKGICEGSCTSKASGRCTAPCQGPTFAGGQCFGCRGTCFHSAQASVATLTACAGTCRSVSGTCPGICQGTCTQPMTNVACSEALKCEADNICLNSCRLQGQMAAKCAEPLSVHLRVAGDFVLYDALKTSLPALVQTFKEVLAMRAAVQNITDTSPGAFRSLGVQRDVALLCATEGSEQFAKGLKSYNNALGATRLVLGLQF